MPIDTGPGASAALFLFAHQDDEFGVFHTIEACVRAGRRVACAYLTRAPGALAQQRNTESLRVLARLGVPERDIVFAGDILGIDDAGLPERLADAQAWIAGWVGSFAQVELLCVTAWEGGHHDHDALHAIAVRVARDLECMPALRQFALYNRLGCAGPLFRVLAPLTANGPVERWQIPAGRRIAYLRLCLSYPSQAKTWLGLFPFVLAHYLWRGEQALQPVAAARLRHKPHEGTLYYEQRQFYRWEQMQTKLREWNPDL